MEQGSAGGKDRERVHVAENESTLHEAYQGVIPNKHHLWSPEHHQELSLSINQK